MQADRGNPGALAALLARHELQGLDAPAVAGTAAGLNHAVHTASDAEAKAAAADPGPAMQAPCDAAPVADSASGGAAAPAPEACAPTPGGAAQQGAAEPGAANPPDERPAPAPGGAAQQDLVEPGAANPPDGGPAPAPGGAAQQELVEPGAANPPDEAPAPAPGRAAQQGMLQPGAATPPDDAPGPAGPDNAGPFAGLGPVCGAVPLLTALVHAAVPAPVKQVSSECSSFLIHKKLQYTNVNITWLQASSFQNYLQSFACSWSAGRSPAELQETPFSILRHVGLPRPPPPPPPPPPHRQHVMHAGLCAHTDT